MNKIAELMFSLINNGVLGKEIDKEKFNNLTEEDYKKLFKLSKSHDLAHIVGYAIEKNSLNINESVIFKAFQKETFMAIYRYESISYELNSICKLLEKMEIPFIPLKGSVIRKYYPEPWMRTSCDIDILVHEEDLERASIELSKTLNYTIGSKDSHDMSLFSPSNVHLELHFNLIEDSVSPESTEVLSGVWNDSTLVENCKYHRQMSNEMFYFYHIAHMAKHFKNGGCGIRPFLDILIMQHQIIFDVTKLNNLLEKGNLIDFENQSRNLCAKWFNNGASSKTLEMMEEFILTGGVYGTTENMVNVGQNKKGGKVGYICSRIFVPYDYLKVLYPSLEKHKCLLPFYEIRRWFRLLFKKGSIKHSVSELKATKNISKEDSNKTAKMLKELGL